MPQVPLAFLDYLHDAVVHSVVWDASSSPLRRVRLAITVDADTEYEPWEGKTLTIDLSDVVLFRLLGYGHQTGVNRIDSFREGVSAGLADECQRLKGSGITVPPLLFTIVFGDGSTLEVTCGEVIIEDTGA